MSYHGKEKEGQDTRHLYFGMITTRLTLFQVLLIVLYTLTTLLAVVGNLVVIGVLLLRPRATRREGQLNRFLLNLAAADLLLAIFCVPFTFTTAMLGHWIFKSVPIY